MLLRENVNAVPQNKELDIEATLFSQPRFIGAIVKVVDKTAPIELQSAKNGTTMCGVKRIYPFGLRRVALAPFGLYAHPSNTEGSCTGADEFIDQLQTHSTLMFEWNVRFDHGRLAEQLQSRNIPFSRPLTHVLALTGSYDDTFGKFNSTTRNLVRRAKREGVLVRSAQSADDVKAYYEVHTKLVSEKGTYRSVYPRSLFDDLLRLGKDVLFLVAEVEGKVAGGAWFFRDGATLMYWHAAMNRDYSKYSPGYALVDQAIRIAYEEGRLAFNFGGSVGLASLEQFKSKWGAEPKLCWCFQWRNPVWEPLQIARKLWKQHFA